MECLLCYNERYYEIFEDLELYNDSSFSPPTDKYTTRASKPENMNSIAEMNTQNCALYICVTSATLKIMDFYKLVIAKDVN